MYEFEVRQVIKSTRLFICLNIYDDRLGHLLDLDTYGGTGPLGMFLVFLERTANVTAPSLSVVFRRLIRLVPAGWRQANDTPI